MDKPGRRGWLVVGVCFLTLVFVFGSSYNTASVFFTPILKSFGWSRARVSSLEAILALAAGMTAPLSGWLLDWVEARWVMGGGAVAVMGGFAVASQAHSFTAMAAAYVLIGLGIGGGTLLPCAFVIANWFGAQRGLAMGIAMSGTALGGSLMAPICNRVIQSAGWRDGFLVLIAPVLFLVIPLIMLAIRTRPANGAPATVAQSRQELAGLEVGEALRTRSLWFIGITQLCFAFSVTGINLHMVPCLLGFGYSAASAAWCLSLVLIFGAAGKLAIGVTSDHAGGRMALCGGLLVMALGAVILLNARGLVPLMLFVVFYGTACGTPLVLVPIVLAESAGLKRYGSLGGFVGIFQTIGAALGPIAMGRLFDLWGSYTVALETCAAVLFVGAMVILGCRRLAEIQPEMGEHIRAIGI